MNDFVKYNYETGSKCYEPLKAEELPSHNHVKANITDFAHTHQMSDIEDYNPVWIYPPGVAYVSPGLGGLAWPFFSTISGAMNDINESSLIIVYPGTYNEKITFNGNKTIYFHDGAILSPAASNSNPVISSGTGNYINILGSLHCNYSGIGANAAEIIKCMPECYGIHLQAKYIENGDKTKGILLDAATTWVYIDCDEIRARITSNSAAHPDIYGSFIKAGYLDSIKVDNTDNVVTLTAHIVNSILMTFGTLRADIHHIAGSVTVENGRLELRNAFMIQLSDEVGSFITPIVINGGTARLENLKIKAHEECIRITSSNADVSLNSLLLETENTGTNGFTITSSVATTVQQAGCMANKPQDNNTTLIGQTSMSVNGSIKV